MNRSNGYIKLFFIITGITLLFLYVILPFIHPVNGHDAWVHLNWLEQFTAQFRAGDLYPRWMPDSFYGMGAPSFYFYPPLAYWAASFVSIANSQSVQFIFYATMFVGAACSFVTSRLLFQRFASKQLATLGSLLYIIAPYAISNIFRRAAFSEQFTLAFLPLVYLAIEILRTEQSKRISPKVLFTMAIGTAGMLLGSVPLTIVAIYTTPIYYILSIRGESMAKAPSLVLGALLGVCLASIYLLPIIAFYPTVRTGDLWGVHDPDGKLIYALTFFNGTGGLSLFYFPMFILTVLGYVLTAYLFVRLGKRNEAQDMRLVIIAIAGVGCFICIIQLPFLRVLWENAPFLRLSQFSWRFNTVSSLLLPLGLLVLFHTNPKRLVGLASIVVAFSAVLGIGYILRQEKKNYYEESLEGHRDVTEYINNVTGQQSHMQLLDVLNSFASDADIQLERSGTGSALAIDEKEATALSFSTQFDTAVTVRFKRQYFPQWRLVDEKNERYTLLPDSTTRFTAVLPAGHHKFRLFLEESPLEKVGKWLSGAGLIITAVLGFIAFRRRRS